MALPCRYWGERGIPASWRRAGELKQGAGEKGSPFPWLRSLSPLRCCRAGRVQLPVELASSSYPSVRTSASFPSLPGQHVPGVDSWSKSRSAELLGLGQMRGGGLALCCRQCCTQSCGETAFCCALQGSFMSPVHMCELPNTNVSLLLLLLVPGSGSQ